MDEKPLITQQDLGQTVEYLRPLNDKEMRFALYLAVGDGIPQAGRRVGIGRSTAYEWADRETVKLAVQGLTLEAAVRAKRRLSSAVNRAVRNMLRLGQPGGASHKGAPTELEANKLVIQAANLDALPVLTGTRRIVTYMPRPDRIGQEDLPPTPDHDLGTLALPPDLTLPLTRTPDGLPPDLTRTAEERASHRYATPEREATPGPDLSDPAYWTRTQRG